MMNLLITGAARLEPEQIDSLRTAGHQVWFLQNEQDTLPVAAGEIEGVICNGLFLHHDIAAFTNLRYIQLTSAGYDRVPMDEIRSRGITIHNAWGVYSAPMAEYAVSAVLLLYKQWVHFLENQRNREWQKHRGLLELSGKRVCIVGCGDVGTQCARRFGAFGCQVIGINRTVREDLVYDKILPLDHLSDGISDADILVLTLPLTEQTRHLIGHKELAELPDGGVIVNIARGGIIDTEALVDELRQQRISAVLDVFEEEPLPASSPLWELPNVILTPHNSFVGEGNGERLWQLIKKNLEKAEKSERYGI